MVDLLLLWTTILHSGPIRTPLNRSISSVSVGCNGNVSHRAGVADRPLNVTLWFLWRHPFLRSPPIAGGTAYSGGAHCQLDRPAYSSGSAVLSRCANSGRAIFAEMVCDRMLRAGDGSTSSRPVRRGAWWMAGECDSERPPAYAEIPGERTPARAQTRPRIQVPPARQRSVARE